jgi:hypothetical protein
MGSGISSPPRTNEHRISSRDQDIPAALRQSIAAIVRREDVSTVLVTAARRLPEEMRAPAD